MAEPRARILVVDDEGEILKPIAEAFRLAGFATELIANPLMVESLIGKTRYQAVVTDLKMAHVDGADVVKMVRTSLMNRDTPVFVMSAYVGRTELERLCALGIQGILVKPFRNAELVARVTAVLSPNPGTAATAT